MYTYCSALLPVQWQLEEAAGTWTGEFIAPSHKMKWLINNILSILIKTYAASVTIDETKLESFGTWLF